MRVQMSCATAMVFGAAVREPPRRLSPRRAQSGDRTQPESQESASLGTDMVPPRRRGWRGLQPVWQLSRSAAKFPMIRGLTTDHENAPTRNQQLTAIFEGGQHHRSQHARPTLNSGNQTLSMQLAL